MKKIYLKPAVELHALGLTTLMAASNQNTGWEHDQNPSDPNYKGDGSIEKEDGGESFAKQNSFNTWDDEE